MPVFANQAEFDDPSSFTAASQGIISPVRREIRGGILFRFGANEAKALSGPWWFDQTGWNLVAEFAALNQLPMAHAARVLAAVAHRYSRMKVLRRAEVIQPLLAWEGQSKPQTLETARKTGIPSEYLAPPTEVNGKPFLQLFIPGVWNPGVNAAALKTGGLVYFGKGESHIFGTRGVPVGTVVQ